MGWLNGWVQGVLLVAGVAVLLRVVRMNAATRYWLWLAALVAVAALQMTGAWRTPDPVVIGEAPALTLPIPEPKGDWLRLAPVVWGLGALALVARLGWSYRCVRKLVREAAPAPDAWQQRLGHWRKACGANRAVRLCASTGARAPLSFGLSDPVIVLPRVSPGGTLRRRSGPRDLARAGPRGAARRLDQAVPTARRGRVVFSSGGDLARPPAPTGARDRL